MPLIKVRAKERGYYDATPGLEIIRNEGEVFEMDTAHMHRAGRPSDGMNTVIKVRSGTGKDALVLDFVLPYWVERAEDSATPITAADEIPKGHTTRHDKDSVI